MKTRITRGKSFVNLRKILMPCFTILIFIIGAFFYMWPHHQMIKISYTYQGLMAKYQRLLQENRVLRLELASISSLDRIERVAKEKMGFSFPKDGQIVFVKDKN